jgi:hypothetical protein
MIANIASDDALILPHRANPQGWNFRERQVAISGIPAHIARMATPVPQFKVEVRPRSASAYTYVITRSDEQHWAEWGGEYPTPEAASAAGEKARQRHMSRHRVTRS